MQYVGVSECDMEKGQLRCDANVSVRAKGRGEVRNQGRGEEPELVPFAKMALDYEIARQVALIESGGKVFAGDAPVQRGDGRDRGHAQQEHAHD